MNNLLTVTTAQQPYTNSYFSVFNAPQWATAGYLGVPPDATPQLSRFDGTNTLGTWRAMVSDQFSGDTGTWQGWSLIVTPRAFTCTPFAPTAAGARIAGQVVDAEGRGVRSVSLTLTGSTGNTFAAISNAFGYFEFADVPVGQTYILNATSKRYSFSSQAVTVQDDVVGLVVTAE